MSLSLSGSRPCAETGQPEMTEEELVALKKWLLAEKLTGKHLEIGTAAGGTLCFLMNCYSGKQRPPFAVIDMMRYFKDQMKVVKENLSKNGLDAEEVDFRVNSSDAAFDDAKQSGETFSFILVDAAHKIRYVMQDLRWMGLLEVGGIACFHDYSPRFKGVTWPLDRFLRRNRNFSRVGLEGSLICIRKEALGRREVTSLDQTWAWLMSPLLQWESSLRKRMNQRKPKDE